MLAVMCVDLEPDQRETEHAGPALWEGASALLADANWLRTAMSGAGRPALNWFVRIDPQIEGSNGSPTWAAEFFGQALLALETEGDGVGLHPHNWRWCSSSGRWVSDGTHGWVEHVVGVGLTGFADTFGRGCTMYRHGDRFMSQAIVRTLLEHPDVMVDLTLEPGTPAARGLIPAEAAIGVNCHIDGSLSHRFQPSDDDMQIPAEFDGRLTMVPLTTAAIPGSSSLHTLALWLDPIDFRRMLSLRLLDPHLDHLAFAIRSDIELIPERDLCVANLAQVAEMVPDLHWVEASTMALPSGAPICRGVGVVGSMAQEVARLNSELDSIHDTVTWRARQRLLPLLRWINRIVRRTGRRAGLRDG